MKNKEQLFNWCLQQAALIVAAYRAEAPKGFNVFNQSYSATTPEQHRRTLLATLTNPNPRVREQAKEELDQLERDELQRERNRQFGVQQSGLEENRQQRMETSRANRESRELYQQGIADTRQERTAIAKEAQDARRAQGLQLAMNDPNLSKEERAAAKQQYLATLGVQATAPTAGAKGKGEYGPGGAPAAAPAPAPAAGGYAPPTAAFTSTDRSKTFVSPQDLSPGVGASPARADRAADLRNALREHPDLYTEGERSVGIGPVSAVNQYDPATKANIATNAQGQQVVVGAGDPSVGALKGSRIKDLGKTRYGNEYQLSTPSGGTIESTYKGDFGTYAAAHPQYRNVTGLTPEQIAGNVKGMPNPVPTEQALGGGIFTPPTAAFTTGGSAAQPAAAPAPASSASTAPPAAAGAGTIPPPYDASQGLAHRAVAGVLDLVLHKGAPPWVQPNPSAVNPKVSQQPPLVPPPTRKKNET